MPQPRQYLFCEEKVGMVTGSRLSCQVTITSAFDGLTIRVPEEQ